MKASPPITAEGEWCPWVPKKKRAPIVPVSRGQFWTDKELVAVYLMLRELERLDHWQDICLLVRLVLSTGLRVSEACSLQTHDCDPDGVIVVRKGKGGKRRSLRVNPEFLPFLQRRLEVARGAFISKEGLPICSRTAERWWDRFVAKCRANSFRLDHTLISRISIHGGRHTYATHEIGFNRLEPHEAQAQLGHASVAITLQVYRHAMAECLRYDEHGRRIYPDAQWWGVARGDNGQHDGQDIERSNQGHQNPSQDLEGSQGVG